MTYPTAAVNTGNADAGTDVPATARSDILDALQKLNQMIAHTTAFAATLLDDVDAATARATLSAAAAGANTDITSMTGLSNGGIPVVKVAGAAASGANSDITSLLGASSGGITGAKFQISASTDLNMLDAYQEGVWTPQVVLDGYTLQTYTLQQGLYIRIGKLVIAWFNVTMETKGTDLLGQGSFPDSGRTARLIGMPFNWSAPNMLNLANSFGVLSHSAAIKWSGATTPLTAIHWSSKDGRLSAVRPAGTQNIGETNGPQKGQFIAGPGPLLVTDLTATATLSGCISYFVMEAGDANSDPRPTYTGGVW